MIVLAPVPGLNPMRDWRPWVSRKLQVSYQEDLPSPAQSFEMSSGQKLSYARCSTAVESGEADAKREYHDVAYGTQEVDLSTRLSSGGTTANDDNAAAGGDGSASIGSSASTLASAAASGGEAQASQVASGGAGADQTGSPDDQTGGQDCDKDDEGAAGAPTTVASAPVASSTDVKKCRCKANGAKKRQRRMLH